MRKNIFFVFITKECDCLVVVGNFSGEIFIFDTKLIESLNEIVAENFIFGINWYWLKYGIIFEKIVIE